MKKQYEKRRSSNEDEQLDISGYLNMVRGRLHYFIETYYDENYTNFSKASGIKTPTLSRIKNAKDTSISMLKKVENGGLSLTWLVCNENEKETVEMFANNKVGQWLKKYYEKISPPGGLKTYDRTVAINAKVWIEKEYKTIKEFEDFAEFHGYDTKTLNNILELREIPDSRFLHLMDLAGCSIKSLLNDYLKHDNIASGLDAWLNSNTNSPNIFQNDKLGKSNFFVEEIDEIIKKMDEMKKKIKLLEKNE